jgi:hypothetical protein
MRASMRPIAWRRCKRSSTASSVTRESRIANGVSADRAAGAAGPLTRAAQQPRHLERDEDADAKRADEVWPSRWRVRISAT